MSNAPYLFNTMLNRVKLQWLFLILVLAVLVTSCQQTSFITRKYRPGKFIAQARQLPKVSERSSQEVRPAVFQRKQSSVHDVDAFSSASNPPIALLDADTIYTTTRRKYAGKVKQINDVAVMMRLVDSTTMHVPLAEVDKLVHDNGIVESRGDFLAQPVQLDPSGAPLLKQEPQKNELSKFKTFLMVVGLIFLSLPGLSLFANFTFVGLLFALVFSGIVLGINSDKPKMRRFFQNLMVIVGAVILLTLLIGIPIFISLVL